MEQKPFRLSTYYCNLIDAAGFLLLKLCCSQVRAAVLRKQGWSADRLRDEFWEPHHSWAGDEFYSMAIDLRGFYLKVTHQHNLHKVSCGLKSWGFWRIDATFQLKNPGWFADFDAHLVQLRLLIVMHNELIKDSGKTSAIDIFSWLTGHWLPWDFSSDFSDTKAQTVSGINATHTLYKPTHRTTTQERHVQL